jgi:hypothetical protein
VLKDLLARLPRLSDGELLAGLRGLVASERRTTTALVAHLAELESRGLHLQAGHGSLFAYCRDGLGLSEHEAYNRIEVARASRRYPVILERLAEGAVHLTAVRLLAPHLTPENHAQVLDEARGKRKAQIEEIVARLAPWPDAPTTIRRLPAPRPTALAGAVSGFGPPSGSLPAVATPGPAGSPPPTPGGSLPIPPGGAPALRVPAQVPPPSTWPGSASQTPTSHDAPSGLAPSASSSQASAVPGWHSAHPFPPRPATVTPLAPDRYKLQVTIAGATLEKLRLAKDMLRHALPTGDEAVLLDRALTALLADLARRKFAATGNPRPSTGAAPGSRHVPAEVRRAVWLRDLGRCAFVAKDGRRCGERAFLEFHHVRPWAVGGEASVGNIQLRCRGHNGQEARAVFGRVGPVEPDPRRGSSLQNESLPPPGRRGPDP